MSLDRSDVEKIAHLARLQLDDADIPEYAQHLSNILALVDQMQAADTSALEPMANPHDASQRLRADAVTEQNQREALQANAPATENGLFLVPKVIE
ncbi:Asp-tRNA(Asn)/Glu-tRNA(Gln) amidotransferase subunit GatC [Motiliproteus sediminis]|uniref:Asp-tRNA(Asn)/Glu-tRNA(Gln) amidotransferase subunit GatC n=1 Tax=Motiliproteus sediminis TaxID=1468178 RepID=UPI001AEFBE95|nr:Asp-tRNA(Asn)/Glu-tRNA(Gln) amidotransferase subunit GatC [Motiliproteus sediminis]